jgi:hypothetical protein
MRPLRLVPAKLRALAWGLRAVRVARRQLARGGLGALALPPPPGVAREAKSGVEVALQIGSQNCLVRSAVRQAWYAAQGHDVDLVIGVTSPRGGFKAHAWLATDPPDEGAGYAEITRHSAGGRER